MRNPNERIIRKMFLSSLSTMIFSMLTAMLGVIVDGIVIGKCLGEAAMTAYGIAGPAFTVVSAVSSVFSSGGQALCASAVGGGRIKEANGVLQLSLRICLLTASAITVGIIAFSAPLAMLLGAGKSAAEYLPGVRGYLIGLSVGFPGFFLVSCLQPVVQLDGDKACVFRSVIVMGVSNAAGDLLNVSVLHGGLLGMGAVTSASYYAGLIVLVLHFRKSVSFHLYGVPAAWSSLGKLVATGLPTAIQRVCDTLRMVVLNRMLLTMAGSMAVAAFSVQNNMNYLFGAIASGTGLTTLLLTGIFKGERDRDALKGLLRTALLLGCGTACIGALVLWICSPFLAGIYLAGDSAAFPMAAEAIRFFALFLPLHTVGLIFINYLQGTGNLGRAHLVCVMNALVAVVASALVLKELFGVTGIWAAFPVGKILVIGMLFVMAAFYQGHLPRWLDDFLFLPADFDVPEEDRLVMSARSLDEVMRCAEKATDFCVHRRIRPRTGYFASLCIEEMGKNIIQHGFADGRPHHIDIRLVKREDELTISIRDDCTPFDPEEWMKIHDTGNEEDYIGIRLAAGVSKEFTYMRSVNVNHLLIQL